MKIQRKSIITAGGTLMCALGIGYFMQGGALQPAPSAQQAPAAAERPAVSSAGVMSGASLVAPAAEAPEAQAPAVQLEAVTLTSAAPVKPQMPTANDLPAAEIVKAALEGEADAAAEAGSSALACDYEMTAEADAAAMVRLKISAPCVPNERFTLHHNGMMLSDVTGPEGNASLRVPALSEAAVFIAAFGNGEGAVATAEVGALTLYDRAVVQWQGNGGFQLHAFEFGADHGSDGHVRVDHARDLTAASDGAGGFLTQHGDASLDDAFVAQVYTFPRAMNAASGEVVLSVEAEVTAANCGRDVEAQSIQKTAEDRLKTQALVLAMPECSAVGDFLVLKNLLNDLKVAAR